MLLRLDTFALSDIDYLQQQRTPSMIHTTQITVTQRPIGQEPVVVGAGMKDTCGKAKRHAPEANTGASAGDSKE
jgi:hypothetical protein